MNIKNVNYRRDISRGFSLMELLIVLGIAVLLTYMSFSPFRSFQDTQAVGNAQDSIISLIVDARTKTLSSLSSSSYGVHFSSSPNATSSQIVEFVGPTYIADAPTNIVVTLADNAQISGVSLNGGGVDMIFNRLTGGTNQYGTITLQVSPAATIFTRTIEVNKAGAVTPSN